MVKKKYYIFAYSRPSTGGSSARTSSATPAITHRVQPAPNSGADLNTSSAAPPATPATPITGTVPATPSAPRPNRNVARTAAAPGANPTIQLADLQNFLQRISSPGGAGQTENQSGISLPILY